MKTDTTVSGFIFRDGKVLLNFNSMYGMWLGFGGHVRENEIPDERLISKIKQEVGLDVEILNPIEDTILVSNNTIRNCKLPFHADLHFAGDHHHYAQYYICLIKNADQKVEINKDEKHLVKYQWFTKDEVKAHSEIFASTKEIVGLAFSILKKHG